MPLMQYTSGGVLILYKVITGTYKGRSVSLGIAFRTSDAPIGYLPFYGRNDFDFNGSTSIAERLSAHLPIDLSSAGSPHTLLLKETAGDVEFLGSGSDYLIDIQRAVKQDLLRYAMACASGVLVDGMMVALGGPLIKSFIAQLVRSQVQQFILSKAISSAAKKYLKDEARVDVDRLLDHVP